MTGFTDDPLDDLARHLRTGAGSELRAEAEIAELETHQGRLRRRSQADVARQAAARGDQATLLLSDRTISGAVTHVGRDYVTIETETEIVDARLAAAIVRITPRRQGGLVTGKGSATWKARLAEFESTGEPLTAMTAGGRWQGMITVAATDHVIFVDEGSEMMIPYDLIDFIVRPRH